MRFIALLGHVRAGRLAGIVSDVPTGSAALYRAWSDVLISILRGVRWKDRRAFLAAFSVGLPLELITTRFAGDPVDCQAEFYMIAKGVSELGEKHCGEIPKDWDRLND